LFNQEKHEFVSSLINLQTFQ